MKNQKGFIQIPLLIAIIAGVLVLSGVGYFGVRQYQNYQAGKIEKEKTAQEIQQQKDSEVENLKREVEALKNQKPQIIIKETSPKNNNEIVADDIQPYLPYVSKVSCWVGEQTKDGSGFLMSIEGVEYLITNAHVVSDSSVCNIYFPKPNASANDTSMISGGGFNVSDAKSWNKFSDSVVVRVKTGKPISPISNLPLCSPQIPLGTNIAVIGYPITTTHTQEIQGFEYTRYLVNPETYTIGVISAYENPLEGLNFKNYFTTAQVDSGNSGGLALSKENGKLCLLGIPTWVSQGNFQNQGIIQNWHNIIYQP